MVAEVNLTVPAKTAVAAINGRVEGHPVAGQPGGHGPPDLGNDSGHLVSHDDGGPAPTRASVHAMNVAAANPARPHPDQDFIGLHRRHGHVLDRKTAVFFEDERFHVKRI